MVIDLNVKPKTIKLFKDNVGESPCYLRQIFLRYISKTQSLKERKKDKCDFIPILKVLLSKPIFKMRIQTTV